MKGMIIIFVLAMFLLAGCRTVYVCYDGTEEKIKSRCPTIPVTDFTEMEAGKAMDSYGIAVAQAKGDTFTRVNIYQNNTAWYSGVLFTNKMSGAVTEAKFRIDGKTGTVTCISGCDYVNFK